MDEPKKRVARWQAKINKRWMEGGDLWGAFGDEQLLENVCNSIQRFSRDPHWTRELRADAVAIINDIASSFVMNTVRESRVPNLSKSEMHRDFKEIQSITLFLNKLVMRNYIEVNAALRSLSVPVEYMVPGISDGIMFLYHAVTATLNNPDFKRSGAPEVRPDALLELVLGTWALMERVAGRAPGFGRKSDHSSSPLSRTVSAMYHFATGESVDEADFNTHIARAESFTNKLAAQGRKFVIGH